MKSQHDKPTESGESCWWRMQRRLVILSWAFLLGTIVVPVAIGVFDHVLWGGTPVGSILAGSLGLLSFLSSFYFGLKYNLMRCPHCDDYALRVRNLLWPLDPKCPKCHRQMNLNLNQSGG